MLSYRYISFFCLFHFCYTKPLNRSITQLCPGHFLPSSIPSPYSIPSVKTSANRCNADDLGLAREFLPPASQGHILLTTRASSTGRLAKRIEIEKLGLEEGTHFLLHRAGLL